MAQVQTALGAILRDPKAKEMPCGVFGSFGWSGEAVDELEKRLKVRSVWGELTAVMHQASGYAVLMISHFPCSWAAGVKAGRRDCAFCLLGVLLHGTPHPNVRGHASGISFHVLACAAAGCRLPAGLRADQGEVQANSQGHAGG